MFPLSGLRFCFRNGWPSIIMDWWKWTSTLTAGTLTANFIQPPELGRMAALSSLMPPLFTAPKASTTPFCSSNITVEMPNVHWNKLSNTAFDYWTSDIWSVSPSVTISASFIFLRTIAAWMWLWNEWWWIRWWDLFNTFSCSKMKMNCNWALQTDGIIPMEQSFHSCPEPNSNLSPPI